MTSVVIVLTAEVKYSSWLKIALKTAGENNMTHDLVNIFFKLLLKNLLYILHFGTNYSQRIVHMYFFYNKITKDRCSDFNQQRPPLTEDGLPVPERQSDEIQARVSLLSYKFDVCLFIKCLIEVFRSYKLKRVIKVNI